jgi:hypothetical protein
MIVFALSMVETPWMPEVLRACALGTPPFSFRWITAIDQVNTDIVEHLVVLAEDTFDNESHGWKFCDAPEFAVLEPVRRRFGLKWLCQSEHGVPAPVHAGTDIADGNSWSSTTPAINTANATTLATIGGIKPADIQGSDNESHSGGALICVVGGDSTSLSSSGYALATLASAHNRVLLIDGTLSGEAALLYSRRGDAPGMGELIRHYAQHHDFEASVRQMVDHDDRFDLLLGIAHPEQSVLLSPRFVRELLEWSLAHYEYVFVTCDPASTSSPFLDILEVEERLSLGRTAMTHAAGVVTVVETHELGVVRFAALLDSAPTLTSSGIEHCIVVLRTHASGRAVRAIRSDIAQIAGRRGILPSRLLDANWNDLNVQISERDTFARWLQALPSTTLDEPHDPVLVPVGDELASLYRYFESLPE